LVHHPADTFARKAGAARLTPAGSGEAAGAGSASIGRYKAAIGPRLRVRTLPGQQGEAAIAVAVLNRIIRTAKPVSVRSA
jgi:hypothetical protein